MVMVILLILMGLLLILMELMLLIHLIAGQTNDDGKMNKHDMAYRDFKDLARRTISDKEFNIAKNGYQRGLASLVYKLFDKKSPLL